MRKIREVHEPSFRMILRIVEMPFKVLYQLM